MGRFYANEADNYGGSGGSSFFALKDDGDTARVRFMYNGADDVVGYACHEVEIEGKRRYVNCIRSYNEPKSKCPFCAAGNFQKAKLYVPVYDTKEQEVKIWERGKNFFPKISSLCARYATSDKPFVAQVFDVERHGKKGDTQTSYEIYPVGSPDDTRLEDLPEAPEVLGGIIIEKSAEDMEFYVNNGYFPNSTAKRERAESEDTPTRRTPSRRSSEAF